MNDPDARRPRQGSHDSAHLLSVREIDDLWLLYSESNVDTFVSYITAPYRLLLKLALQIRSKPTHMSQFRRKCLAEISLAYFPSTLSSCSTLYEILQQWACLVKNQECRRYAVRSCLLYTLATREWVKGKGFY